MTGHIVGPLHPEEITMSEPTPETTPSAPTDPTPTPSQPTETKSFTQDDVNAMLAKQKREQFGDYGDLKAQALRLAEIEESQRSEAEKIAARATAAEKERDDAKAEGLRYKAAATHGVGTDYFDLLGSDNDEAINGRAVAFGELTKAKAEVEQLRAENEALRAGKPVPSSGRPVAALRPGATPSSAVNEDDVLYNSLFGG